MGGKMKKKVRIKDEGEDRISTLPDEVIHKIMFYLGDTKSAVQTSILSNRWKLIWKTLPFLTFKWRTNFSCKGRKRFCKFVDHVFSHRNHDSTILTLDLAHAIPINDLVRCVNYAIFHNVQELSVSTRDNFDLSIFRSCSLKILKLYLNFEYVTLGENHSWDLPALTTLELMYTGDIYDWKFLESCLICLPALTSLLLHDFVLPTSLSLPSLTSLRLEYCELLQTVCDFPALVSLVLDDVTCPSTMTENFSTLVSLQNLSLTFAPDSYHDCFISCPHLLNLRIETKTSCLCIERPILNIIVSSPKLRNFDSVGIFTITCGVSSLEHVNIKLQGYFELLGYFEDKQKISKRYYQRLTLMFPGLGSAKILTFDSETLEALSEVSGLLGHFPSPFYNLKYVKLPKEYKESSLSSTTISYLLGGSPGATIVTTLPQNDVLTRMVPVSLTAQNVDFEDPLATTATKEPVDLLPKKVSADGNYGLWQGYEVNSDFVDVLDLIMKKYPETFENFTCKSKKLCTMKLNLLCTSVNDFRKTSMNEFCCEMIAEFRELFADLERSFNIKWLVNHLNYIEQLHFPNPLFQELHAIDSHIDDAKSNLKDLQTVVGDAKTKLQDLQARTDNAKSKLEGLKARTEGAKCKLNDLKALRMEMMTAMEDASENMDTILAASAGCIGDVLFSGL